MPASAACAVLHLAAETPKHSHHSWREFTPTTWVAVGLAGLVTAWVIYKAVMYTIHPGEEEEDHIKRVILSEPEGSLHVGVSSTGSDAGAAGDDDVQKDGLTKDDGGQTDA